MLRTLKTFQKLGIDFISQRGNLHTATTAGRMMFTMIAAMAEMEIQAW